jgi:hypothetical protein
VNEALSLTFIFKLLSWDDPISKPRYTKTTTKHIGSRESKEIFTFTEEEFQSNNCTNITCFYHFEIIYTLNSFTQSSETSVFPVYLKDVDVHITDVVINNVE